MYSAAEQEGGVTSGGDRGALVPHMTVPIRQRALSVGESPDGIVTRKSGDADGEGARELMRAVLLDAIACLRLAASRSAEAKRLAEEARYWMLSTSRTWPFAFEAICDVLGISATYLRRVLLAPDDRTEESEPSLKGENAQAMLRRLSRLRMRGNQITHIRAKRVYERRRRRVG